MSIFGGSGRQAILIYIEKKCGLKQNEYLKQPETFHEALRGLFGHGAETVEKHIAKALYRRLGLDYEEHEKWTIVEYVEEARKMTRNFI